MPIPELTNNSYYLPPGEHQCTLQEAEERFAGPNSSKQRKEVWGKFCRCLDRMLELGLQPEVLLINGSFVTGRESPGDVDGACLISPETLGKALQDKDPSDTRAILAFAATANSPTQSIIRDLFGAHIMVANSPDVLEDLSELFRVGGHFRQLKEPDPIRDPDWVTKPQEKGILKVDLKGVG
ncbi:MAG: hypothetical protein GX986_12670 [Firmicutes bacterium]|nr:hypothetical protein [Bacillota bacterium]